MKEENKYHFAREIMFNLKACKAITDKVYLHWIDKLIEDENQAKNNESLHIVGVREFECDDIVCTKDGRIWMITEIDGDDVYACGNGKKYYPLEKSEITHAH